MSKLEILSEKTVNEDVARLSALWSGCSTFFIVPDKPGLEKNWLEYAAKQLPDIYRKGNFGILTSGSTGEPKLILGNKIRSEKLALLLHDLQESRPVRQTICSLPLSYSYSLINQWLWSHVLEGRLVLTQGFSHPDTLAKALCNADNAMLCMVGSQASLIHRYFRNSTFPSIIRLHFAGGRFPQEQLNFLRRVFPNAQIYNNYGCAEAMPRLTLRKAEEADDASHVGFTLPGVEMKTDKKMRLLFRSPYRAIAYIDHSGFHEISDEEWLQTGDLGKQLSDGSWRLLGRANDVFKRFGEKISVPLILSTVNITWSGDSAIYHEKDPNGELGCVLVLSPEPDNDQLREILLGFRKYHRRPHWPLRIESTDHMPCLANGKTDILGLSELEAKKLHWRQRI